MADRLLLATTACSTPPLGAPWRIVQLFLTPVAISCALPIVRILYRDQPTTRNRLFFGCVGCRSMSEDEFVPTKSADSLDLERAPAVNAAHSLVGQNPRIGFDTRRMEHRGGLPAEPREVNKVVWPAFFRQSARARSFGPRQHRSTFLRTCCG